MIFFIKNRAPIELPVGCNLMEGLLKSGVPVASSCRGDAVCGKCWVRVLEGSENLDKPNEAERHLLSVKDLPKECRISCQAHLLGDIKIDTPYW